MTSKAYQFIVAILGQEGGSALRKAAERSPLMDAAMLPRTVWAWLQIVDGMSTGYEGNLPGIENSYIALDKTEAGYQGVIGIDGQESYSFAAETLQHVAAGIVVALGADADHVDPALALVDLQRLGKSIDILAKSKLISAALLAKAAAKPNQLTHLPPGTKVTQVPPGRALGATRLEDPIGHADARRRLHPTGIGSLDLPEGASTKPKKTVKAEPPGQAAQPTAPQEQASPLQPAKQPKPQGTPAGTPTGTSKNKAATKPGAFGKSIRLPMEAIARAECRLCREKLFRGEDFCGCLCFDDLKKSVTTARDGQALVVNFGRGWDAEALMTLMETLRPPKQS